MPPAPDRPIPDARPIVSVLVPAYGCAPYLAEALTSLQAQTLAGWEAIVVDDGSPDDVVAAMAPFADDPRIRLLRTDNGGLAVARNRALAAARAPLVALLDGDDVYEAEYLDAMVAAAGEATDIGFVTCDATFFGDPRLDGRRFSETTPQVPPITLDRVLRRQFNVFGGCLILVAALDEVGGWTAGLRAAEDFDLWIRLLGAGWRCGFVPRPLHRYRRRGDSLSAARPKLLAAVAGVYDMAAVRLAGRPEADTARAMRAQVEAEIAFDRGEALVLQGSVPAGLAELRRAGIRTASLPWRLAMLGMRMVPGAAPGFMRWRIRAAERG